MRSLLSVAPLAALLLGGGLALSAHDLAPAAEPEADLVQTCEHFTLEKLTVWQSRLGLDEWKVSIILTKRSDLKPRTLGGIHWDKKKHTAVINVMHPSDYEMSRDAMFLDMEETVVHELIHLKLSSLNRSEAARSSEEEAVNGLAGALLKLERSK